MTEEQSEQLGDPYLAVLVEIHNRLTEISRNLYVIAYVEAKMYEEYEGERKSLPQPEAPRGLAV